MQPSTIIVVYDSLEFSDERITVNSIEWLDFLETGTCFRYTPRRFSGYPLISFSSILRKDRSYWYCRYKPKGEPQRQRYMGVKEALTISNMELAYDIITLPLTEYLLRQQKVRELAHDSTYRTKTDAAKAIKEICENCRADLQPGVLYIVSFYLSELEELADSLSPKSDI